MGNIITNTHPAEKGIGARSLWLRKKIRQDRKILNDKTHGSLNDFDMIYDNNDIRRNQI